MKVEYMKWITREIVRANPRKVFLFGDNLERKGFGGQAKEMRGEPNAVGIPTKIFPSNGAASFMRDSEYDANVLEIGWSIIVAKKKAKALGGIIVIPSSGLGTGLAELDKRAPKTFAYLQKRLADLAVEHTK